MTKAERKEAARLEREQLKRKIERQRRVRLVAIAAGVVVVALAIALVVALQPESEALADPAQLLEEAPAAIESAGCGKVQTVPPYDPQDQDRAHVDASQVPPLSTYPSTPPASGPHNGTPLPAGVYGSPIPVDQAIHSLEHGATIVWYDETASGGQLDRLKRFYEQQVQAGTKIIVSPYDYPDQGEAGRLPNGAQMSLAAWHHVQSCGQMNLAASFDFVSQYTTPPMEGRPYLGDAPEPSAGI